MGIEIKELSGKLAQMYGVDAITITHYFNKPPSKVWLAADSGRISDLSDDNGICVEHYKDSVLALRNTVNKNFYSEEDYINHPTKHDAARMARVRCLLAIRDNK